MIFFPRKLKSVLLNFLTIEVTNAVILIPHKVVQTDRDIKLIKKNTTLFVGMVLLFLTGCTAQQIGQLLEKIPDTKEHQTGGKSSVESSVPFSQDNSDNSQQPSTATIQAAPKIIFFKATPPFVMDGGSTTLEWRTDDVTSAQILGIGAVSATGTREVTPQDQTRYELVATNSAGQTVSDEIIINKMYPMIGEAPEGFKIRGIKRFNILNPKKKIVINPQVLNKIKLKAFKPVVRTPGSIQLPPTFLVTCAGQVQGKIAWDYKNNKRWAASNINRLCKGAVNSPEPARCFQRVMHGGVNWGGGTKWKWNNVIDLCEGSTNSNGTISCFQRYIRNGRSWLQAIKACSK